MVPPRVGRIRRYFGMSMFPNSVSAIQTLIAAIGSGSMPAIWDGGINVTQAAGVASSVADARGAGFAPPLTASGTAQPSVVGSSLVFDGVNNIMTTGAGSPSPLFDVSGPYTVFLIGSISGAGNFLGIADGVSPARLLLIQTLGGVYATNAGTGHTAASSVVASGTTELLCIGSSGAAATNIDVPNKARVTTAITMCAAGNCVFSVGAYWPTGAGKIAGKVFTTGCISRVVTAADITALKNYAVVRGATLQ